MHNNQAVICCMFFTPAKLSTLIGYALSCMLDIYIFKFFILQITKEITLNLYLFTVLQEKIHHIRESYYHSFKMPLTAFTHIAPLSAFVFVTLFSSFLLFVFLPFGFLLAFLYFCMWLLLKSSLDAILLPKYFFQGAVDFAVFSTHGYILSPET